MVNFFYASATYATWFVNTVAMAVFEVTNGARQGCVSSMWFYTLGTLTTNTKYRSSIVQVADDVYIFRNALLIADDVLRSFQLIGQELAGDKSRILSGTPIPPGDFPTLLRHVVKRATTTPAAVLGGFVNPCSDGHVTASTIQELSEKIMKPIRQTYAKLDVLDAALQDKLLILKALTYNHLYLAETLLLPAEVRAALFSNLDAIQRDLFNHLFPAANLSLEEANSRYVLTFTPLEDGIWTSPLSACRTMPSA